MQRGDSVSRLADRFGIAPAEIIRLNGLVNPSLLRLGTRLRLPDSGPAANPLPHTETPAVVVARLPNVDPALASSPAPLPLRPLMPVSRPVPPGPRPTPARAELAEPMVLAPVSPTEKSPAYEPPTGRLPFTVPAAPRFQVFLDGQVCELWENRVLPGSSVRWGHAVSVRDGGREFWRGMLIDRELLPVGGHEGFVSTTLCLQPAFSGLTAELRPVAGRVPRYGVQPDQAHLVTGRAGEAGLTFVDIPVGTYELALHFPGLRPLRFRLPLDAETEGVTVLPLRALVSPRLVERSAARSTVVVAASTRREGQVAPVPDGAVVRLAPVGSPALVETLKKLQALGVGRWEARLQELEAMAPPTPTRLQGGEARFANVLAGTYRIEIADPANPTVKPWQSPPVLAAPAPDATVVEVALLVE